MKRVSLFVPFLSLTLTATAQEKRALTPEDLVGIRGVADPKISPDGKRIAFVATLYKGHFHIFRGDFNDGTLQNLQRLKTEEAAQLQRRLEVRPLAPLLLLGTEGGFAWPGLNAGACSPVSLALTKLRAT